MSKRNVRVPQGGDTPMSAEILASAEPIATEALAPTHVLPIAGEVNIADLPWRTVRGKNQADTQRLDIRRPYSPRMPRVLVPVQLDVLLVRTEEGAWADCRMKQPDKDGDIQNDASHLLPDPFKELSDADRRQ